MKCLVIPRMTLVAYAMTYSILESCSRLIVCIASNCPHVLGYCHTVETESNRVLQYMVSNHSKTEILCDRDKSMLTHNTFSI
jgi:hypothetical protein